MWWPPEGKYYRATITKRKERRSSHNIYYHATFANDGSIGYDLQVKTHHLIPHGSGDERERASKLKRRRNTADNDVDDREDQGSASTSAHAASSLSASAVRSAAWRKLDLSKDADGDVDGDDGCGSGGGGGSGGSGSGSSIVGSVPSNTNKGKRIRVGVFPSGKVKYKCSIEGCLASVACRGVCRRHGAFGRCNK